MNCCNVCGRWLAMAELEPAGIDDVDGVPTQLYICKACVASAEADQIAEAILAGMSAPWTPDPRPRIPQSDSDG